MPHDCPLPVASRPRRPLPGRGLAHAGVAVKTVWKFPVTDWRQEVAMPMGAKVLHVAEQQVYADQSAVTIWAEVDDQAPMIGRGVAIVGTGQEVPEGGRHIGTVLQDQYVWHIYLQDEPTA